MRVKFTIGKWLSMLCLTVFLLGWSLVSDAQTDTLWGVTSSAGGNGFGDLFSMKPDGSNLQAAYGFGGTDGSPVGSLIKYNGILYGFTPNGGSNSSGEIFSYNPVTLAYTSVYSFDGAHGAHPNGKLTADPANGLLYGVTTNGGANSQGVIFSFDPASGTYTDLYDFYDNGGPQGGSSPAGPLTLYNNVLYGRASGGANAGGVLFSFDPAANVYTDLYNASDLNPFQSDPSLVVSGNLLYGISDGGGANGDGVLFSFDPVAMTYTELVTFDGIIGSNPIGIVSGGGLIYGVTQGNNFTSVDRYGELFSFNPATHKLSTLYQFSTNTLYSPAGNILFYNGSLLGMATSGGAGANGGVFSYNLAGNTYTEITDFGNSAIGNLPNQCQLLLVHTVGAAPQTITFSALTKRYGDATFDPGAVASSGLPVTYSSDNTGVAIVNGGQVRIVGVGTANISANQAGNATYDSITMTAALTVSPAPLLITADDTVRNQDLPNPVFRLTYTGLTNGDSAGSLTTAPGVSTTADSASLQGTYPITVSGAADSNYTITYQAGTLTVIGLLQHITFIDSSAMYGGADVTPARASSGLPVTYTSSKPAIASVTAGQQLHILTAGTTQVIATQAGDAQYAPTMDTLLFVVAPAPLSIVADNKTKVYNQPDPVFTATYSGFINGDDTNSLTAKPVFTTTAGPGAPPGTYVINAGSAADSNYAITYQSGTYLLTPVQGDEVNSLDTWFSSNTSLQVNVWVTATQQAVVQVYDVGGRRLISEGANFTQGYNTMTLPAGGLAAGVYIIRVTGTNFQFSKTIRKVSK